MEAIAGKRHAQPQRCLASWAILFRLIAPDIDGFHPRERHSDASAAQEGSTGELVGFHVQESVVCGNFFAPHLAELSAAHDALNKAAKAQITLHHLLNQWLVGNLHAAAQGIT